jgi:hypothetical protein
MHYYRNPRSPLRHASAAVAPVGARAQPNLRDFGQSSHTLKSAHHKHNLSLARQVNATAQDL